MKKWLKIWVVALAMLATVATLASTGNVKAEDANNRVEVVIWQYNSGQNTCTGSDYHYVFTASTEQQEDTKTWSINCKFWNMSWQAVSIQLDGALTLESNSAVQIPAENVKLTNGTWVANPEKLADINQPGVSDSTITTSTTLFNKANNTIGDADTNNIAIKVIVPAWQPDGTYNGTLVLSYGG